MSQKGTQCKQRGNYTQRYFYLAQRVYTRMNTQKHTNTPEVIDL